MYLLKKINNQNTLQLTNKHFFFSFSFATKTLNFFKIYCTTVDDGLIDLDENGDFVLSNIKIEDTNLSYDTNNFTNNSSSSFSSAYNKMMDTLPPPLTWHAVKQEFTNPVWRAKSLKSTTKPATTQFQLGNNITSTGSTAATTTTAALSPASSSSTKDFRLKIFNQNQQQQIFEALKHENIIYEHSSDKPWICKLCHRRYKWKNSLKSHLTNECGVPPKYHCTKACGYKTHVYSNMKRHLRSKFCSERNQQQQQPELLPEQTAP
jgi:hypothetical protein